MFRKTFYFDVLENFFDERSFFGFCSRYSDKYKWNIRINFLPFYNGIKIYVCNISTDWSSLYFVKKNVDFGSLYIESYDVIFSSNAMCFEYIRCSEFQRNGFLFASVYNCWDKSLFSEKFCNLFRSSFL